MNEAEFSERLRREWGAVKKPPLFSTSTPAPLMASVAEWTALEPDAKSLAIRLYADFCGCLGSYRGDGDLYWVLKGIRSDLEARAKQHSRARPLLVRAIDIALSVDDEMHALITPFLFSEIEGLFRSRLAEYVRYDGVVIKQLPPGHSMHDKGVGKRLNNIKHLLELNYLVNNTPFEAALKRMDAEFAAKGAFVIDPDKPVIKLPGGMAGRFVPCENLGAYFNYMRNAVMHGAANVIGTDAVFLLLLVGQMVLFTDVYN